MYRPRGARSGLGLIELLIGVGISSVLLGSVTFAFHAGYTSFKDAQQRGQMLNVARGSLYQITADIRSSESAAPYDPVTDVSSLENTQFNNQIIPGNPTPGLPSAGGTGVQGIQLLKTHPDSRDPGASADNPVIIRYWLDAPSRTLYMTRKTGSATPTPFAICRCVQSMQIYMQPLSIPPNPQAQTGADIVCRRVVVTVALANEHASGQRILAEPNPELTLTFSDSAVPRKMFPGL